jgi:hypothetical protein
MNNGLGKFLALFFAACLFASQFHCADEVQVEHIDNQIFHIENVSSSLIDNSFDNRFIYVQQFAAIPHYLFQQQTQLIQPRQYIGAIERQTEHPFRHLMLECLETFCQSYDRKLFTSFSYQQKLALSFEFSPFLISNFMRIHSDESDSHTSLS